MLMEHTASHETTVAHTVETGDAVMAVGLAFGVGLVVAGALSQLGRRPRHPASSAALGDLSGIGEVNGYEDDDPRA